MLTLRTSFILVIFALSYFFGITDSVETHQKNLTIDITNSSLFHTTWQYSEKPLCSSLSTDDGIATAEAVDCYSSSANSPTRASTASTCFRVTFRTFGFVTISLLCVRPVGNDATVYQFNLDINRVDKPPECVANTEVRIPFGDVRDGSPFFLRASDPDTDDAPYFSYEILSNSLADLQGYLTYCDDCSFGGGSSQWRNLTDILADNNSLSNFDGMFGYHAPPGSRVGFSEKILFVARDLADEECDPPGVVTFRVLQSSPPSISNTVSPIPLTVGLPQTYRITASSPSSNSLSFALVSTPDPSCAFVCPVPQSVVQALAAAPGTSFTGSVVDCDGSQALTNRSDITLVSPMDSYFFTTFVVLKPLRPCTTSFAVVATDGITSSEVSTIGIVVVAARPGHCAGAKITAGATEQSIQVREVFDSQLTTQWSLLGWVDANGVATGAEQFEGKVWVDRIGIAQPLGPLPTFLNPTDVLHLRPPFLHSLDAIFLISSIASGAEVSGVTRCKLSVVSAQGDSSNHGASTVYFILLCFFALIVFVGAIVYWRCLSTKDSLYRSVNTRDAGDAEMRRSTGNPSPDGSKIRWKEKSAGEDDSVVITGSALRGSATLARRDVPQRPGDDDDEFSVANQPAPSLVN